jgi:hypothetical protein
MTVTLSTERRPAREGRARSRPGWVRSTLGGFDAPLLRLLGLLVGARRSAPARYLVWRTNELGWAEAWEIASSERTLGLLWSTLRLAVAVTAASVLISLPIAWLTTRTDLPWRGSGWWSPRSRSPSPPTWAAWADDRCARSTRHAPGMARAARGDARSPIYGFWGCVRGAHPVLVPVRAAHRPGGLPTARPEPRRGQPHARPRIVRHVRAGGAPAAAPVDRRRLPARGAVHAVGFRRRLDAAVRHLHPRDLRPVPGRPQPQLGGGPRAGARGAHRSPCSPPSSGSVAASSSTGCTAAGRRAHGARLGVGGGPPLAAFGVLVFVALVVPLSVIGYWMWRGARVGEPVLPDLSLVTNSLTVSRSVRFGVLAALPVALLVGAASRPLRAPGRAAVVVGLRAAGHRRGAGARVLRRPARPVGVPDHRHAGVRVRRCCSCPRRSGPSGRRCSRSRRRSRRRRACSGRGRRPRSAGWCCRSAVRVVAGGCAGVPHLHEGAAGHAAAVAHRIRHPGHPGVERHVGGVPRPGRRAGAGAGVAVVAPDGGAGVREEIAGASAVRRDQASATVRRAGGSAIGVGGRRRREARPTVGEPSERTLTD